MRKEKEKMRRRFFVGIIFFSFLILLTGCSSGGGDTAFGLFGGDTSVAAGNATISGEVSGTVIVAINESNAEVARVTAAGTPKTFTFTVPTGHTYRIFLIENEDTLDQKIFALYNNATGTNCFAISSSVTIINFGYIDTTNGVKAIPTYDPLLVSGVSSIGENKSIPEIVLSGPPPTGTLSDLVGNGLALLKQGSVFKAKAYFKAAVTNYPDDNTNNGDTARFFYAVTRLAGVNPYSDGNSTGTLNSIGDILDRMGINNSDRNSYNYIISESKITSPIPQPLPDNYPTGNEMQIFLYNVIRPELEGALANLNGVQNEFEKQWANPIDSKYYKSDYADVLLLKAAIKGALAGIYIQYTYNLDVDIDLEFNKYKTNTVQSFLGDNGNFLKLLTGDYSTLQSTAKTYLSEAADHLTAAINKIQTRNTADYLVNLKEMTSDEFNDTKTKLAAAKSSLSGSSIIGDYNGTDVAINLLPFFGGLDLRNLLPPVTGNTAGFFPDATMGGIIVEGFLPNEDLNSNGIPDILE